MKCSARSNRKAGLILALGILLHSTPALAQWVKLIDDLPSSFIGIRLVTVGQTLYVFYSDGNYVISRSTNYGDNWTPLTATFPPSFTCSVTAFAASGSDLYLGNCSGIFRLQNGDSQWTDISGNLNAFVTDFLFKGNKVFVSTSGNGIFQSYFGDTNWIPVNNGLTSVFTGSLLEHENYIYVLTTTGIFRSADEGASWIPVNNGLISPALHVIGANEDYLFAGTNGTFSQSGFHRSANGGLSWIPVYSGLPTKTDVYLIECIGNDIFISGESWTADHIGVFTSSDNGTTWTADGLQWYWINSVKACGNYLFAGTGNMGLWRRPYPGGAQLTGEVTYNDSLSTPLPGCTVYLTLAGDTVGETTTDSTGHFSFSNPSAGNYEIRVHCGLPWGGANAVDALLVLKHFTGMSSLQGLSLDAANVDANAFVNAADALMLTRRFVGMISAYNQPDWIFQAVPVLFTNTSQTITIKGCCSGDINASLFN